MMETTVTNSRLKAEKRVGEIRGFYIHCVTYCILNLGLFCINYFLSYGHWWFYWPLLGWGIGLFINGLSVWKNGLWGSKWKERKINEMMNRD